LIVCEISITYMCIVHRFLQCPIVHCFYGDFIIHTVHFF
ncbi:hypothetical protein N308_03250, partial [Struthio camelus australis]